MLKHAVLHNSQAIIVLLKLPSSLMRMAGESTLLHRFPLQKTMLITPSIPKSAGPDNSRVSIFLYAIEIRYSHTTRTVVVIQILSEYHMAFAAISLPTIFFEIRL